MHKYRQNFIQKYRNGIFTNITTFIYRNIFLHFNINSNLGKTQGQLEAKQYDGRCVGVEKKYKTSVTSKEDKQRRQAQNKCRLCTWFVEKTKKCKKLDKSQHCGGVGAMPPLGGSGLPTICD